MIEAKGLTKRYGATVAVDNLSFEVKPGKVTGFLGPNGAGKSTTMRMILGLDTPTSGDVSDRRPALPRPEAAADQGRRPAGRQVGAPEPLGPGPPGLDGRVQQAAEVQRSTRCSDMVGLTSVAGKRAGAYSLGMSQRLGIAGALLGDPEILLFDEPVNGLDPEGIVWIRTFMHRLADEGRTVLVSSHLLSEMAQTAEELIVIGRGKLIAQCTTNEFVDRASGTSSRCAARSWTSCRPCCSSSNLATRIEDVEDEGKVLFVDGEVDHRPGR